MNSGDSRPVGELSSKPSAQVGAEVDPASHGEGAASSHDQPGRGGIGSAMRMGTEMVTATLLGLGMGYFLDQWLGTHPWMTLLFFLFGSIAGFRNMYRIVNP